MVKIIVVCANLIEKDGTFLLVQESKERVKGKYNMPAGKIEGNESLIEGAKREAKEETGLHVEPEKLVGVYQSPTSRTGNNIVCFVFKSKILGGEIQNSEAHPDVRFFSFEEIKEMDQKNILRSPYIMSALNHYKTRESFDLSTITSLEPANY